MRIAWLTDVHLDFLDKTQVLAFLETLNRADADVFLISGDISLAHNVCEAIQQMADTLQKPIYFVLGNHDFYHGSIAKVRAAVRQLCEPSPYLAYLTASEVISLAPDTALIGHDGWADLQYGDFKNSSVWMNDYVYIRELQGLKKVGLLPVMAALAEEAAEHFLRVLPPALDTHNNILVLTHVPPFMEACWHEGKISDKEWLPHFTCKAVGDILRDLMANHLDKRMTVLCGHTHGQGKAQILPNLKVYTGGAEYGQPRIQAIFSL